MKRVWLCRNLEAVVLLLAQTDTEARAAAFALWNDDPDEVRDVTDALRAGVGPLIALVRERVAAHDGSGPIFRFPDPARAFAYWLGDTYDVCPTCAQPVTLGDATKALEPLIEEYRRRLAEIGRLTAEMQQLRNELQAQGTT